MTKAVVALGANLSNPRQQLIDALAVIKASENWTLVDVSSLYRSTPLGPQDQPDYVNAVCIIDSQLNAFETLQALHQIEDQFGRTRVRHWGERTLDLDLILFGSEQSDQPQIQLPHPGLYQREFVLYPLAEIVPTLRLPNGQHALEQSQQITENGLQRVCPRAELLTQLRLRRE